MAKSFEDKEIIRKQKAFIRWLKKSGIYTEQSPSTVMLSMQEVWEESQKEIAERDDIIRYTLGLTKRAIKDIGYHVDYHESSVKYYDHDALRSQMGYIDGLHVNQWRKAHDLGVELNG